MIKQKMVQVEKYGVWVWSNESMDANRRTQCLCLNCDMLTGCSTSEKLYGICKQSDIALMVTRCPDWESND